MSLVCFEWKYMMFCVSLCKLKFVFPCANVISVQDHGRHCCLVTWECSSVSYASKF